MRPRPALPLALAARGVGGSTVPTAAFEACRTQQPALIDGAACHLLTRIR